MKHLPLSFALIVGLTAIGCASAQYKVRINSFTAASVEQLSPPATIAVVPSASSGNALFADEVRRKAESLLRDEGYRVAAPEDADILVFAVFGMGQPRTESQTIPLYSPDGTTVDQKGNVTVIGREAGSWSMLTRSVTQHDRWMMIAAADAAPFHTENLAAEDIRWLWISEVISSGRSSDLRKVIDYMLVPAMEWFGKSTGEIVSVQLDENDGRVVRLRTEVQE